MRIDILELIHEFITVKTGHNDSAQLFCLTGLSFNMAEKFEKYVTEGHPVIHNGSELTVYVFDPDNRYPDRSNFIDEAGTVKVRNGADHHFLLILPYGLSNSLSVETTVGVIGIEEQAFVEMESLNSSELYRYVVGAAVHGESEQEKYFESLIYRAVDELLSNDNYHVDAIWEFLSGLLACGDTSGLRVSQAEAYCGYPSSAGLKLKAAAKAQKDFHKLFFDAVSDNLILKDLIDTLKDKADGGEVAYSQQDVADFEQFINAEISRFESLPHLAWGEKFRSTGEHYSWWSKITLEDVLKIVKGSEDRSALSIKEIKALCGQCENKRQPILFVKDAAFDATSHIAEEDTFQVRKQKSTSAPIFETEIPASDTVRYNHDPDDKDKRDGRFKLFFGSEKTQRQFSYDVMLLEHLKAGMHLTIKDTENISGIKVFKIKNRNASKTFHEELTVLAPGDVTCQLFVAKDARVIVEPVWYDDAQGERQQFNFQKEKDRYGVANYTFRLNLYNELSFKFKGSVNGDAFTYEVVFYVKEGKSSGETSNTFYDEHVRRNLLKVNRPLSQIDFQEVTMPAGLDVANVERTLMVEATSGLGGYPISMADDYKDVLLSADRPDFSQPVRYTRKSHASNVDPRPAFQSWKQSLDTFGAEYKTARLNLFTRLAVDYPERCIEEIDLAQLDPEYETLITAYADGYRLWLASDYTNASVAETIWIFDTRENNSLGEQPNQVVVPPLHPLRLSWLYWAQKLMGAAERVRPSAAVSIFDSDAIPDMLHLPVTKIGARDGAVRFMPMFSVRSSSRYWGVLHDYSAQANGFLKPENIWSDAFGINFVRSSKTITKDQVESALNDAREMCMAKPSLSISFSGDSSKEICREGILSWNQQFIDEDNAQIAQLGPRRLKIYDVGGGHLPSNETIAAISDQSEGAIQWFAPDRVSERMDLSIATLAAHDCCVKEATLGDSVTAVGGLACYRSRKLCNGSYVIESRRTSAVAGWRNSADQIPTKIASILSGFAKPAGVELTDSHSHVGFPTDIKSLIENEDASYYAISSADIDHACFVAGSGNGGAYLWDYRLPQNHLGARNTDGFYLLARETPVMMKAVSQAISSISGGGSEISEQVIANTLHITAQRGIPTIKDLTLGGTKALGEVGILIAVSALQGDITQSLTKGLLPPYVETEDACWLNFVVPFDPFRKHFESLIHDLDKKVRPDLAALSVACKKNGDRIVPLSIKYSFVEVKARTARFSDTDKAAALKQYSTCHKLLKEVLENPEFSLHSLAVYDFLVGLFTFGYRVYGTFRDVAELNLDGFYTDVVEKMFSQKGFVVLEDNPRLLVVDSATTKVEDEKDGVHCTVRINGKEACDSIAHGVDMILPCGLEKNWGMLAPQVDGEAIVSNIEVENPEPMSVSENPPEGFGDTESANANEQGGESPATVNPEQTDAAEDGNTQLSRELQEEVSRVKEDILDALGSASIQGTLIEEPKVAPNSIVFTFDGRPQSMSVATITSKATDFKVHYGLEILRVVPKPRKVCVHIKREHREVIKWSNAWPRVKSLCQQDKKLYIGVAEEDARDLFLDPINRHGPHTLVAGATGSGKSVLLRNLLYSIGETATPQESRIILIDPKMGQDYFAFNGMPHFYGSTDENAWVSRQDTAQELLQALVAEMEARTYHLSQHHCENLTQYQELIADPSSPEWLPRLWVFHDEFAMWMLDRNYKQLVDSTIAQLAVMARSAGIHLVFATQRPSHEVVSVQTRNNLTNRLILKVSDEGSSNIALGKGGAESLLGQGHILIRRDGEDGDDLVEGQVAFHHKDDVKAGVKKIVEKYAGISLCEPFLSRRH